MARQGIRMRDSVKTGLIIKPSFREVAKLGGFFEIIGRRAGRTVVGGHYHGPEHLFRDVCKNLVTSVGLTYITGAGLLGVAADSTWFVGLADANPAFAAGDTLASHAGWTEATEYDEVNRQAWTGVAGAAGAASNSSSPSVFTINATISVEGAFIASVNTGTSGTLLCEAPMAVQRDLIDNDVITVIYNWGAADDGV